LKCPECDGEIKIPEDATEGEIVTCPDCGSSFEVYLDEMKRHNIRPSQVVGEDWGE
jgi:alpha-aminoadipate carrier protein LysW